MAQTVKNESGLNVSPWSLPMPDIVADAVGDCGVNGAVDSGHEKDADLQGFALQPLHG